MKSSPPYLRTKGISLVEIVVASAIVVAISLAAISAVRLYAKFGFSNLKKVQAVYLAEEGLEVMRHLRDQSWAGNIAGLSAGAPYYLRLSGGVWQIIATEELIGEFRRTVVMENVYRRNSDKNIVAQSSPEPKTLDAGTKKAVISVYFSGSGSPLGLQGYIANLWNN